MKRVDFSFLSIYESWKKTEQLNCFYFPHSRKDIVKASLRFSFIFTILNTFRAFLKSICRDRRFFKLLFSVYSNILATVPIRKRCSSKYFVIILQILKFVHSLPYFVAKSSYFLSKKEAKKYKYFCDFFKWAYSVNFRVWKYMLLIYIWSSWGWDRFKFRLSSRSDY